MELPLSASRIEKQLYDQQIDQSAETIAKQIYQEMLDYRAGIPDREAVVVEALASYSILVEMVDYIGSTMIVFRGTDTCGNPSELIQHISQINFLLRSLPLPEGREEIQIGFH